MATSVPQHPNILLVLTDQQRDVGDFDTDDMRQFARDHLKHQTQLAHEGTRFAQHRISSAACVPSRASIFTGQSPWVHGIQQTDGFAKLHSDNAMRWLDPVLHQTLGHRFKAAGYATPYLGKWHLSRADLNESAKPFRASASHYLRKQSESYKAAQPLARYGFEDWIGPEPHGPNPLNAGLNRDEVYVDQASQWLRNYSNSSPTKPFMMVVSLVNPHDIVFWPAWSIWRRGAVNLMDLPPIGASPSQDHVPTAEPSVLGAYRTQYGKAYGPASIIQWLYRRSPERYRRFYCGLLKQADAHLGTLLSCLDETGLSKSTHVVFSSDHGEMLGAHGGLHQKWYNAFEETLRVPLIIRKASQADSPPTVRRDLSTHLDLVPTLMGLAQITAKESDQVLPGRDLFDSVPPDTSYFLTSDRILEGENREGVVGRRFPILRWLWPLRYVGMEVQRTSVEAIVSTCQMHSQRPQTWKLVRYFNPNLPQVQPSDEWNLFHLDVDPNERHDLANSPDSADLLETLKVRLEQSRAALGGPRSNQVSGGRYRDDLHVSTGSINTR